LIWYSILELVARDPTPAAFVTANSKDFGEAPHLHEDLLRDFGKRGIPRDRMRLYSRLEDFNQDSILPLFARLDDMIQRFAKDEVPGFSLRRWIEEHLFEKLHDSGLEHVLSPIQYGSAELSNIEKINSVVVDDVRVVGTGRLLVSATTNVTCTVTITVEPEDFEHDEVQGLFGEERDDWAVTDEQVEATVALSLIIDESNYEVLSSEIDELEGPESGEDLKPHPRREELPRPQVDWAALLLKSLRQIRRERRNATKSLKSKLR
jgi:hypothetical protein